MKHISNSLLSIGILCSFFVRYRYIYIYIYIVYIYIYTKIVCIRVRDTVDVLIAI